jgi:hypothetical protein
MAHIFYTSNIAQLGLATTQAHSSHVYLGDTILVEQLQLVPKYVWVV